MFVMQGLRKDEDMNPLPYRKSNSTEKTMIFHRPVFGAGHCVVASTKVSVLSFSFSVTLVFTSLASF